MLPYLGQDQISGEVAEHFLLDCNINHVHRQKHKINMKIILLFFLIWFLIFHEILYSQNYMRVQNVRH